MFQELGQDAKKVVLSLIVLDLPQALRLAAD